ncbi:MAG TPA: response regulator [Gemmatimonadales bacterium]
MGSIIVADDEEAVRQLTVRILTEEGYSVYEARDGEEAMHLAEQHAPDVALVLSDILMPRLNGVQLLEHLSRRFPSLPVLLMSGYSTLELMTRAIAVPCGYLTKPFPAETLLDEVRRCLATAA